MDDITAIEVSGKFNKAWYLQRYPDVAASGLDPIQHYVRHGAAEGRDPSEWFSTNFYLRNNPDVAASKLDPFRHYIEHGSKEGRICHPTVAGSSGGAPTVQRAAKVVSEQGKRSPKRESDVEIIARSGVFDEAYYLSTYAGAVSPEVEPIAHYLKSGAADGKNPCAFFDTRYYLTHNADVAASGMNPLVHFCQYGFQELRTPSPEFDISWYWLTYLKEDVTTNPLAHYLSVGLRNGAQIRRAGNLSDKDEEALASTCVELLETTDNRSRGLYTRLGVMLTRLQRWPEAETALLRALTMARDDAKSHARLATVLAKQGKWWQAVESWTNATDLDCRRANWFLHLGEAQEKMNRFALAAQAYQRATDIEPSHASWYYLLGYMLEKAGQQDSADAAYAEAVTRDIREDVKAFGIGVFHQARGYWPEAAEAYARELKEKPFSGELHFKYGMAQDRCYRWQEASDAYRTAIALQPTSPYWHYRYGFVLERQNRFLEAAEAYAAASVLNPKHMPYWHYRRGYTLANAGEYRDACLAYLNSREAQTLSGQPYNPQQPDQNIGIASQLDAYLAGFPSEKLLTEAITRDATDAVLHYQLGTVHERSENWAGAAAAYGDAVARSNPHRPEWYYRLGFVLFRAERFQDACEAFREIRILRRPFGVDAKKYYRNDVSTKSRMEYNEYVETLDIRPKTILYESYHGASLSCNPFAIFKYLLNRPEFSDWTHVWSINNDCHVDPKYRSLKNVIFVTRGSDLYWRYLASASHLINNNTFMPSAVRRPEQRYLNTWHGTPIKSLGKDIRDEFMAHRNAARNLLIATHVLSPNKHTSDVLIRRNDIAGVFTGKIAEIGYPRIDLLLNASSKSKSKLKLALGIPTDSKVVLYAPTWRGTLSHIQFDANHLIEDLRAMAQGSHKLLFKGHHLIERALTDASLPVTVIDGGIDTCELLSIVDVLITDYSSIWVDFLSTQRPVIHYVYDWEEYTKARGLYVDIGRFPGDVCRTLESLMVAMHRALEGVILNTEVYKSTRALLCPNEDGRATARAVEFFFNGDDSRVVSGRYRDDRTSLLMYAGGFIPNGITNSCVALTNALDRSKYLTCVAIDVSSVTKTQERIEKFNTLGESTQILGRIGTANWSPEELWVAGRFGSRHSFSSPAMREVYRYAYRKEARRMFGDASFDMVVQFDGYVNFWSSIFAFWPREQTAKAIYLHNDMRGEMETRFPSLRAIFSLYTSYDYLISVSSSVNRANCEYLSTELGIHKDKFFFCDNVLNPATIIARSSEPLAAELREWLSGATVIGTLGRLSPEKGHAKLIRAFGMLKGASPGESIKLAIAGDGPLKATLQAQIDQLGLRGDVRLVGQLSNPYPLLRRMDVFVLSSDYEGQGIVVLEALTLGKPVVSTDVVGPRTILEGGCGLLVKNDAASLAVGIQRTLDRQVKVKKFDAKEYQTNALRQFSDIVEQATRSKDRRGTKPADRVERSNEIIVAARQDGLGERLNAILNGMFLANQLGFGFAYHWPPTSSAEKLGVNKSLHAIAAEDEFFSRQFIDAYSIPSFNDKGFVEISGKGLTKEQLTARTEDPKFAGWLAPRLDLNDLLAEQLRPTSSFNLGSVFGEIGFQEHIATAVRVAKTLDMPAHCVGIHLRSGDIFYGPYRKFVHYTYKGVTLPIAKAIISKVKQDGDSVLLFGQDKDVVQYLKRATGAMILNDLYPPDFGSSTAQAMFEIVLMSRCKRIVAGSSGFAKQASWIAGMKVEHPANFFSPHEQTRISVEDLEDNGDRYHPLQTAFAYWYAYFCGRQSKSFDEIDMLLAKAYQYDPQNQLYPIKRAVNCFRNGKFDQGDAILARLLKSEFSLTRSVRLPAFRVLTARTLGQFNLAEDFDAIFQATQKGCVYAAACDYVIRLATKESAATAFRVLEEHQTDDAVVRALYGHWAKRHSGEEVMARLTKIERPALYTESDKWYSVRFASLDAAMDEVTLAGDFAEFGVYKGRCAEFLVKYLHGGRQLHLFDSFEGLPHDWIGPWKTGVFALPDDEIPHFQRDDVHVHVGLFNDAIPRVKDAFRKPLAFIHADADLYSSTLDVLKGLDDCIAPGTIILFDEYVYESGDEYDDGEHRALLEWASRRNRKFEYLWRTIHQQVAIRVTK